MTALNYLPKTALDVTARYDDAGATDKVTIRLHNPNPGSRSSSGPSC